MSGQSEFFTAVHEIARMIPYGRVTSYGAIARALGAAKSSRMVGYAMNASHGDPSIPAHRVVNRNGVLTGKHQFGSPDEMQQRLASEGVSVENDLVVDFKKLFWDPQKELGI